ncbi:hypothetical protein SERLA73DRAFT_191308 [Serpula lacrymans var. lacrymans S7.3]|uniref:Uncharacterized protein n=2 Tax=Serpula lacrymans var. lacrymans TaxID=341189 RepID=F8QH98_SERL3|nr:uncharacterized protein SERLADRAFT_459931 [Serpula lacrymans var. lacrymans S7.9]EGN92347.1 hypothetical protein SERLA73DRAFT_191308 [Serpula lacrymans var. lacrymans S7.3]EGO27099.1 hypothetical protein SERLADRAFT_459931 [Serpula lacrymans var. lacrymans S7.9]
MRWASSSNSMCSSALLLTSHPYYYWPIGGLSQQTSSDTLASFVHAPCVSLSDCQPPCCSKCKCHGFSRNQER